MPLSVPAGRVAADFDGAIAESVMAIERALFKISLYDPDPAVTNPPFITSKNLVFRVYKVRTLNSGVPSSCVLSRKGPSPPPSMTQDELLKLIAQAAAEGWTELDLAGYSLTELPAEIGQLTSLQTLILRYTQLHSLPESIAQLTNLRSLDLSINQLSSLPESIGQLTSLRSIDLRSNKISRQT